MTLQNYETKLAHHFTGKGINWKFIDLYHVQETLYLVLVKRKSILMDVLDISEKNFVLVLIDLSSISPTDFNTDTNQKLKKCRLKITVTFLN